MSRYGRNDPGEHDSRIVQRCYNYACERVVLEHLVTGFGDDEVILESVVIASDSEDYPVGLSVANTDVGDFQLIDCNKQEIAPVTAQQYSGETVTIPAGAIAPYVRYISGTEAVTILGEELKVPGDCCGAESLMTGLNMPLGVPIQFDVPAGVTVSVGWSEMYMPCFPNWDFGDVTGGQAQLDLSTINGICTDGTYSIANAVNCTPTLNGDVVTAPAVTCPGSFSYDVVLTCPGGVTYTSSQSGTYNGDPVLYELFTVDSEISFTFQRLQNTTGEDMTVHWGNGDTSVVSSGSGVTYTYPAASSPYTGPISIEHSGCAELTWIYARGNNISDISALADVTSLQYVSFNNNNITDVTPLANMSSLILLDLNANNITDITPLAGLDSIGNLILRSNNISDISPVAGLTTLTSLNVGFNNITDITPVSGLTALTNLDIPGNNISDLSPVAGLTALTRLIASFNNISDISPVAGLTALINFNIESNNISDISPVAGLTALTRLIASSNNISDISPVAGLTALTRLFVDGNNISSGLDTVLIMLDGQSATNGRFDSRAGTNVAPSGAGITARDNLIAKGWLNRSNGLPLTN